MALTVVASRIRNLSPAKPDREPCGCEDGFVVVQTRIDTHNGVSATVEEYGPCPYCERGLKIEFAKGMPWSGDGYWRGRDIPASVEQAHRARLHADTLPVGKAAQVAAARQLVQNVGLNTIRGEQ